MLEIGYKPDLFCATVGADIVKGIILVGKRIGAEGLSRTLIRHFLPSGIATIEYNKNIYP